MSGPALTFIVTSRMPVGFRGAVTQWCLEIAPGVFVGTLNIRVADVLWGHLRDGLEELGDGYAAYVRRTDTDQGFTIKHIGDHRYRVQDNDGLQLVEVLHRSRSSGGTLEGLPDPTW